MHRRSRASFAFRKYAPYMADFGVGRSPGGPLLDGFEAPLPSRAPPGLHETKQFRRGV